MAARKKATKKSASRSRSKSASRKSAARKPSDALTLLRTDHQLVQGLFDQFEKTRSDDRKEALAEQICRELTIHAQIEEEIFYPAARDALREQDSDLLDEATVEHQSAKDLIAQIEGGDSNDELWEAKVTVLSEYIKHHVKEEQNELFPKVRKTKLDLKELGERLEARKMELKEGGGAMTGSSRSGAAVKTASGFSGSGRSQSRSSGRSGSKSAKGRQKEGFISGLVREMGLKSR